MHSSLHSQNTMSRTARILAAGSAAILLSNAAIVAQDECTTATPIVYGLNGPFTNVGATTSFA